MRKRRALVIGPTPPPIGGDTVSTRKLLASRYWEEYGIGPVHVNTSAGDRVRVYGQRLSAGDVVRGVGVFMRVARRLPGADVVLLWANSRFLCTAGVPIILAANLIRRPVVVKFFGASLTRYIGGLPGPWRRLVLGTLGTVRCVFPQTERLAGELVHEFGFDAERVVCLPNYLPDRVLEREFRDRRFSGRCIFIGQIKREKGVFDIVEALADQREFTCDFYGPILERDREEFLGAVANTANVRYHGVARPDDVHSLIGDRDLLLLPTYHLGEGYPAAILEAFAAGVPAVATDWMAIPDLVADGERGIIVPPRSPRAIREALQRLGRDGALYETMSRNAFEHARAYSERAIVRDILLERVRRLITGHA